MSDLEELLAEPPGGDVTPHDVERLLGGARERARGVRRRRALTAAGTALAVGLVIAFGSLAALGGRQTASPAPAGRPPAAPATPAPRGAEPCRADDLVGTATDAEHPPIALRVRNTGSSTCVLPGVDRLSLGLPLQAGAAHAAVALAPGTSVAVQVRPVSLRTLPPRSACVASLTVGTATLRLASGVPLVLGEVGWGACDDVFTATSWSAAQSATPPPTSGGGCPASGGGVPAGAWTRTTLDLDGDGRPDTAWATSNLAGTSPLFTFGFTTASGATSSVGYDIAGGSAPSLVFVQPDPDGPVLGLISYSRGASLYVVSGCRLVPVTNPQGQRYDFDRGFIGTGTGIGCSRVAGSTTTTLVGLLAEDGKVRRTQVLVSGTRARNGLSDEVPAPDGSPARASAYDVSCGRSTAAADGVTPPS